MLEPQSVFAWIIIGAIAGWLAGLLVKGYGFGLIGNIVIGILGLHRLSSVSTPCVDYECSRGGGSAI